MVTRVTMTVAVLIIVNARKIESLRFDGGFASGRPWNTLESRLQIRALTARGPANSHPIFPVICELISL